MSYLHKWRAPDDYVVLYPNMGAVVHCARAQLLNVYPVFLLKHSCEVEDLSLLCRMRMIGSDINLQLLELCATERTTG